MPSKRILIMGLPGAGKTTLARELITALESKHKHVSWFNADAVRKYYDDWDFSEEGRIRQSVRMREMADKLSSTDYVICDFVCPLPEMRTNFDPDIVVFVDTITKSRFPDTDAVFVKPEMVDIHVTEQDAVKWAAIICEKLNEN